MAALEDERKSKRKKSETSSDSGDEEDDSEESDNDSSLSSSSSSLSSSDDEDEEDDEEDEDEGHTAAKRRRLLPASTESHGNNIDGDEDEDDEANNIDETKAGKGKKASAKKSKKSKSPLVPYRLTRAEAEQQAQAVMKACSHMASCALSLSLSSAATTTAAMTSPLEKLSSSFLPAVPMLISAAAAGFSLVGDAAALRRPGGIRYELMLQCCRSLLTIATTAQQKWRVVAAAAEAGSSAAGAGDAKKKGGKGKPKAANDKVSSAAQAALPALNNEDGDEDAGSRMGPAAAAAAAAAAATSAGGVSLPALFARDWLISLRKAALRGVSPSSFAAGPSFLGRREAEDPAAAEKKEKTVLLFSALASSSITGKTVSLVSPFLASLRTFLKRLASSPATVPHVWGLLLTACDAMAGTNNAHSSDNNSNSSGGGGYLGALPPRFALDDEDRASKAGGKSSFSLAQCLLERLSEGVSVLNSAVETLTTEHDQAKKAEEDDEPGASPHLPPEAVSDSHFSLQKKAQDLIALASCASCIVVPPKATSKGLKRLLEAADAATLTLLPLASSSSSSSSSSTAPASDAAYSTMSNPTLSLLCWRSLAMAAQLRAVCMASLLRMEKERVAAAAAQGGDGGKEGESMAALPSLTSDHDYLHSSLRFLLMVVRSLAPTVVERATARYGLPQQRGNAAAWVSPLIGGGGSSSSALSVRSGRGGGGSGISISSLASRSGRRRPSAAGAAAPTIDWRNLLLALPPREADAEAVTLRESATLAALHSVASLLEMTLDSPASLPSILRSTSFFNTLALTLRPVLAYPDRSLRLCALRCLVCVKAPSYLPGGGVMVPCSVPTFELAVTPKGDKDKGEVAAMVSSSSLALYDPYVSTVDNEGFSAAAEESVFAASRPCNIVADICLRLEALPHTLLYERLKLSLLSRVIPLLESRRMPPAIVSVVLHHFLGLFYVKFSPLWPAINQALSVAAGIYPRSLWSCFSQQLYSATLSRPALIGSGIAIGLGGGSGATTVGGGGASVWGGATSIAGGGGAIGLSGGNGGGRAGAEDAFSVMTGRTGKTASSSATRLTALSKSASSLGGGVGTGRGRKRIEGMSRSQSRSLAMASRVIPLRAGTLAMASHLASLQRSIGALAAAQAEALSEDGGSGSGGGYGSEGFDDDARKKTKTTKAKKAGIAFAAGTVEHTRDNKAKPAGKQGEKQQQQQQQQQEGQVEVDETDEAWLRYRVEALLHSGVAGSDAATPLVVYRLMDALAAAKARAAIDAANAAEAAAAATRGKGTDIRAVAAKKRLEKMALEQEKDQDRLRYYEDSKNKKKRRGAEDSDGEDDDDEDDDAIRRAGAGSSSSSSSSSALTYVPPAALAAMAAGAVAVEVGGAGAGTMRLRHEDDFLPLGLSVGGVTDSEAHHSSILGLLSSAASWAEGRSRTLLPIFLAFVRDDLWGGARGAEGDADAVEVNLKAGITEMLERMRKSAAARASAPSSSAADSEKTGGSRSKDKKEKRKQKAAAAAALGPASMLQLTDDADAEAQASAKASAVASEEAAREEALAKAAAEADELLSLLVFGGSSTTTTATTTTAPAKSAVPRATNATTTITHAASVLPLPRGVVASRLMSFLGVFDKFRGWDGSIAASGVTLLTSILFRLLSRVDGGVAAASLKVLASMRIRYLSPYIPRMTRLLQDGSYRDEMAVFSLSPLSEDGRHDSSSFFIGSSSGGGADTAGDALRMQIDASADGAGTIGTADADTVAAVEASSGFGGQDGAVPLANRLASEHRALVLPLLMRMMYGKALQRKGNSQRDSPAARRTAVLSYLSTVSPQETRYLLYPFLRPFLFGILNLKAGAEALSALHQAGAGTEAGSVSASKLLPSRFAGIFASLKRSVQSIVSKAAANTSTSGKNSDSTSAPMATKVEDVLAFLGGHESESGSTAAAANILRSNPEVLIDGFARPSSPSDVHAALEAILSCISTDTSGGRAGTLAHGDDDDDDDANSVVGAGYLGVAPSVVSRVISTSDGRRFSGGAAASVVSTSYGRSRRAVAHSAFSSSSSSKKVNVRELLKKKAEDYGSDDDDDEDESSNDEAAGPAVATITPAHRFLTLPRALGLLHVFRDLVKQLGGKLLPHLHLLVHAVTALLLASRVRSGAAVEAESAAGQRRRRSPSEEGSDDQASSDSDADDDSATAPPPKDFAFEFIGFSDSREPEVPIYSNALPKARDIRSLALQRLSDIVNAYPEYDFRPWLPAWRAALRDIVPLLPAVTTASPKPSALLLFMQALSNNDETLPILHALPGAVPAISACLTAGMQGSADAYEGHLLATCAEAREKHKQASSSRRLREKEERAAARRLRASSSGQDDDSDDESDDDDSNNEDEQEEKAKSQDGVDTNAAEADELAAEKKKKTKPAASSGSGPSGHILSVVFTILERLLGVNDDDTTAAAASAASASTKDMLSSDATGAGRRRAQQRASTKARYEESFKPKDEMKQHVPFLLKHFSLRLGGGGAGTASNMKALLGEQTTTSSASSSSAGSTSALPDSSALSAHLAPLLAGAESGDQGQQQSGNGDGTGASSSKKVRLGGRAFARRQLVVLAYLAEYAFEAVAAGRGSTTSGGGVTMDDSSLNTLTGLLLPFLRARRADAGKGKGRGGAAGGGASSNTALDSASIYHASRSIEGGGRASLLHVRELLDSGDTVGPVLHILARLLPLLQDPSLYLYTLSDNLAPGPKAIAALSTRTALIAAIASLGQHKGSNGGSGGAVNLQSLKQGFSILIRLSAPSKLRVGELDYDSVLGALEELASPKLHETGFFASDAPLSPLLPALLYQVAFLMHDDVDMATRAASTNCLTAILQSAGKAALKGWQEICKAASSAAVAAQEAEKKQKAASAKKAKKQQQAQEAVDDSAAEAQALEFGPAAGKTQPLVELALPSGPFILGAKGRTASTIALHAASRILCSVIRDSGLSVSNPTVRRNFLTLLADMVRSFQDYGAAEVSPASASASAQGLSAAAADSARLRLSPEAALLLARHLGGKAVESVVQERFLKQQSDAAETATAATVRFLGSAHLHADLSLLFNDADPEADIFYSLSHVQVHRRARAFTKLATMLTSAPALAPAPSSSSASLFSMTSVRSVILPIALQALHDEAGGTALNDGSFVVSKGRVAKTSGGAGAGSYGGGLQTEAIRLVGSVASALPWPLYLSTVRSLIRQTDAAANEAMSLAIAAASSASHGAGHRGGSGGGKATSSNAAYIKHLAGVERVLIRALHAVIDAFHFDTKPVLLLSTPAAAAASNAAEDEAEVSAASPSGPSLAVGEDAFLQLLHGIVESGGNTGRRAKFESLALEEERENNNDDDEDDAAGDAGEAEELDEQKSSRKDENEEELDGHAENPVSSDDEKDGTRDAAKKKRDGDVAAADAKQAAVPIAPAVRKEIERREVLLDLATYVLPAMWRLLFRRPPSSSTLFAGGRSFATGDPEKRGPSDTKELISSKSASSIFSALGFSGGFANGESELRPHMALSLVTLLRTLPTAITEQALLPKLFTQVCTALRSREQGIRDTARATLAKVAQGIGPSSLGSVIEGLTSTLREGYQVHVIGHALHAVLVALAPGMKPLPPPAPSQEAEEQEQEQQDKQHDKKAAKKSHQKLLKGKKGKDSAGDKQGPHHPLVRHLPSIVSLLLNDMVGTAAETRDPESGYQPKTALKESKACKSPDSMELVASCIPFLPSPAIHSLTAPLLALLQQEAQGLTMVSVSRGGDAASIRVVSAVTTLLRRLQQGILRNPSVTPAYLVLYAHGMACQFLHIPKHALLSHEERLEKQQKAKLKEQQALAARTPAQVIFDKWLVKNNNKGGFKPVAAWTARDTDAALEGILGSPSTKGKKGSKKEAANGAMPDVDAGFVTGAMMQRKSAGGLGLTSNPKDTFTILPEPKMTGTGRYIATSKQAKNTGAEGAGDAYMGSFALSVLYGAISRRILSPKDEEHLSMLESMVPILIHLVDAKASSLNDPSANKGAPGAKQQQQEDVKIQSLAIRALSLLLPFPLPSLRNNAKKLTLALLRAVESSAGTGALGAGTTQAMLNAAAGGSGGSGLTPRTELAEASVRATAVALRNCDFIATHISEDQLRALIALIRADLPSPQRQNSTYSLLKAILSRRLLVPEVYDCMSDVARYLVTSLRPNARKLCSACMLQFLLRYPMSDARLREFLDFFLRNTAYSGEEGRLSVLDMLTAVVTRFPQPVLDDYASYLLLPLTLRLVQDPSMQARAAVGALIKRLFASVSGKAAKELVSLVLKWYKGEGKEHAALISTAGQVLGLAAESRTSCDVILSSPELLKKFLLYTSREMRDAAAASAALERELQLKLQKEREQAEALLFPPSSAPQDDEDGDNNEETAKEMDEEGDEQEADDDDDNEDEEEDEAGDDENDEDLTRALAATKLASNRLHIVKTKKHKKKSGDDNKAEEEDESDDDDEDDEEGGRFADLLKEADEHAADMAKGKAAKALLANDDDDEEDNEEDEDKEKDENKDESEDEEDSDDGQQGVKEELDSENEDKGNNKQDRKAESEDEEEDGQAGKENGGRQRRRRDRRGGASAVTVDVELPWQRAYFNLLAIEKLLKSGNNNANSSSNVLRVLAAIGSDDDAAANDEEGSAAAVPSSDAPVAKRSKNDAGEAARNPIVGGANGASGAAAAADDEDDPTKEWSPLIAQSLGIVPTAASASSSSSSSYSLGACAKRNAFAACADLLLYPHAWVRAAASRAFSLCLSAVQPEALTVAAAAATVTAATTSGKKSSSSSSSAPVLPLPAWAQWLLVRPTGGAGASVDSSNSNSSSNGGATRTLHTLARRLVSQLTSPHLNQELASTCAKNLLAVGLCLHFATPKALKQPLDEQIAAGHKADVEAGAVSFKAPASSSSSSSAARSIASKSAGGSGGGSRDPLQRLFSFACAVGQFTGDVARTAILQWLAAIASKLPPQDALRYIPAASRLLYRISEMEEAPSSSSLYGNSSFGNNRGYSRDRKGRGRRGDGASAAPTLEGGLGVVPSAAAAGAAAGGAAASINTNPNLVGASVKSLANEAFELLQRLLGPQAVIQSLNAERLRVASLRQERKKERAMQKILDPEAAARQREKKQKAKRRQKQRKMEAIRQRKGKLASQSLISKEGMVGRGGPGPSSSSFASASGAAGAAGSSSSSSSTGNGYEDELGQWRPDSFRKQIGGKSVPSEFLSGHKRKFKAI